MPGVGTIENIHPTSHRVRTLLRGTQWRAAGFDSRRWQRGSAGADGKRECATRADSQQRAVLGSLKKTAERLTFYDFRAASCPADVSRPRQHFHLWLAPVSGVYGCGGCVIPRRKCPVRAVQAMAYSKAPKGWQQPWFDSMAGFRLTLGSVGCFMLNVEIIGKMSPAPQRVICGKSEL